MNNQAIDRNIGRALQQLRESKGLTRVAISQRTRYNGDGSSECVTPSDLARIELGEVRTDTDTLNRLLGAMGSTLSEVEALMRRTGPGR